MDECFLKVICHIIKVGRGLEPLTTYLNSESHGEGGSPFTTYAPLPFYVTSNAQSLMLKNTEVCTFMHMVCLFP